MKLSNILLIIFTSLLTFIGLAVNKLYTKFIQNNVVIVGALYVLFTVLVLRMLYFVAKPLILSTFNGLSHLVRTIQLDHTPIIAITIDGVSHPFLVIIGIVVIACVVITALITSAVKKVCDR